VYLLVTKDISRQYVLEFGNDCPKMSFSLYSSAVVLHPHDAFTVEFCSPCRMTDPRLGYGSRLFQERYRGPQRLT
jgi:hypothetical protein